MANNENSSVNKWELSLYEIHRERQPVITNDTEIAVTPRSLHSEVMCPICLDILKKTMTTKDCLHRFCQDCIITALRNSNKECPTCREKLISKRALRLDPNFDRLIASIFPSRDEYDLQHDELMQKMTTDYPNNLRTQGRIENLPNQNNDDHHSSNSGHDGDSENDPSDNEGQDQIVQEMELFIIPLPSESSSMAATRCIRLDETATVGHVCKFMEIRYDADNGRSSPVVSSTTHDDDGESSRTSHFTLYISVGLGEYKPLPPAMTLKQAVSQNWRHDRTLELYYGYRVQPNS